MRISDWSSDVCSSDLDDELALFRGEKAIGYVDRDPLLTLGGEAIDEQCEIDLLPLRADALRIAFERGELILEDHFGIVEQTPDQRGFAVINRTAGQKPQHRLRLVEREIRVDIFRDQRIGLVSGYGGGHQK